MNKKIIWIIVILLIVVIIFAKNFSSNNEGEEFKPIDINIGDEFKEISYPNTMYIVNYEIADVTGDAEKDMVLLIGEKRSNDAIGNALIENMDIVICDTANNQFIKADSKKLNGKDSRIMVADFTGDQILDIAVTSVDGDHINVRIYTYDNGKIKEIWKERNNNGVVFNGGLLDGFKAHLINKKLNFDKTLDISVNKKYYIENEIYNESGKLLKENNSITTSRFVLVEVIKLNDRSGIRTIQRINDFNDNNYLDEVESIWKYSDGKWKMVEVKGMKLGNLLF